MSVRVLVAGSTGVVGRRVVPLLVAAGHDVTARVSHHPSPAHTVTLGLLSGRSRWRVDGGG